MELSLEVKGYIQDKVANIFSWDKISVFGKRVGIDTSSIDKRHKEDYNFTKRKACSYIMEQISKNKGEIVVKTLIDMAKYGTWDQDYSGEVLTEINPILERTMNCRANKNGEILPIFPLLDEEPTLILIKLKSMGFTKGYSNYRDAFKTYRTSPKGSLGLLRASIEGVVEEILKSRGKVSTSNMKENLSKLKDLGILKEILNGECLMCHHKKKDHEFNYAYIVFGLLSHYGSHQELVTEELANFLFTSTSAFIWFLINRYEIIESL